MHSGLHLYKTYLGTLHGGEQEAWGFLQDYLLVGSEEKAGKACRRAGGGWNSWSVKTLSFHPPPPLAWFWARALNLASILEVMMVVALATLHPLPPSELAALDIGLGGFRSNNR